LDEALQALASEDATLVQLVELKFFAGQTTQEAADSMGISLRTANRHWQYAKARLSQMLNREKDD
jgi:DNA-directed RNA polymerase specialized sigma24 family protein